MCGSARRYGPVMFSFVRLIETGRRWTPARKPRSILFRHGRATDARRDSGQP